MENGTRNFTGRRRRQVRSAVDPTDVGPRRVYPVTIEAGRQGA